MLSRATLTLRRDKELVRGYSSMLPVVTAKDWQDIDFAVKNKASRPSTLLSQCKQPSCQVSVEVPSDSPVKSTQHMPQGCAMIVFEASLKPLTNL